MGYYIGRDIAERAGFKVHGYSIVEPWTVYTMGRIAMSIRIICGSLIGKIWVMNHIDDVVICERFELSSERLKSLIAEAELAIKAIDNPPHRKYKHK